MLWRLHFFEYLKGPESFLTKKFFAGSNHAANPGALDQRSPPPLSFLSESVKQNLFDRTHAGVMTYMHNI